jgi:hypothetical protein
MPENTLEPTSPPEQTPSPLQEIERAMFHPEHPLEGIIARSVGKFILGSLFEFSDSKLRVRDSEERGAAKMLLQIGGRYASELQENKGVLALTIMACSLLEMLLLLACLCYKNRVMLTTGWRENRRVKKNRTFLDNLTRTELNVLVTIGEELQWFSSTIPEEFIAEVGNTVELENALRSLPGNAIAAEIAARLAKDARNLLHPGLCLRVGNDLENEEGLANGAAFAGLALVSFMKKHDFELPSQSAEGASIAPAAAAEP